MSQYSWLKGLQQQERQQGMKNKASMDKLLAMSGGPLSSRYGIGTGYGADGQFQRNMPTEMVQTQLGPRMIHEGEAKMQNPDGSVSVIPQSQLAQIQQKTGMQGYATGGTYMPDDRRTRSSGVPTVGTQTSTAKPAPYDPLNDPLLPDYEKIGLPGYNGSPVSGTKLPSWVGQSQVNEFEPPPSSNDQMYQNLMNQQYAPPATPATGYMAPINLGSPQASSFNLPPATGYMAPITMPPPQAQTFKLPTVQSATTNMPTTGTPAGGQTPTAVAPTIKGPEAPEEQVFHVAPLPTSTTTGDYYGKPAADTDTTDGNDSGDSLLNRSLQRMESYAQGQDPYSKYIRDYEQQRQAGTSAAARGALEQQMAQAGVTGQEALTERAMQSRKLGQDAIDLKAKLAEQEGNRAYQAASAIPGQAVSAGQYEIDREKWKDTKEWGDFEKIAEYGDDAAVAAAWEKATGRPLSGTAAINDIRAYARTKRGQDVKKGEQDIAQGDLTLQSMSEKLGADKFNNSLAKISSGQLFTDANGDGLDDSLGISKDQYDAMRGYTAAGTQDWARQLQGANMMLASNDPANIAQAATILSNVFPGMNFSFDQLIGDIGSERFAKGMEKMSVLSNTYDNWDEAKSSVKGMGLIESLGDESIAQQIFEGTKINAIDKEWQTWEDSEPYQWMLENDAANGTNTADSFRRIWLAEKTGELIVDVVPEFTVMGADGKVIYKTDSKDLADRYVTNHPGKNYKVKTGDRLQLKDPQTGDQTNINIGGTAAGSPIPPANSKPGDTIVKDGSVYKVNSDNMGTTEVVYTSGTSEVWGPAANDVIKAGPGSEAYETVINDRAQSVIDNPGSWEKLSGPNDPVYQKLLTNPNITKDLGIVESNPKNFYAPNLGNAYDNNTLLNIDGTLYAVVGRTPVEASSLKLNTNVLPHISSQTRAATVYNVYNLTTKTTTPMIAVNGRLEVGGQPVPGIVR